MNISPTVFTVLYVAIPLLFAISLHEAAHGYVARYFGDSTAEEEGRLSLNPLRHIDPVGTILLPLALYIFPPHVAVGFAKPVPVDFSRLRNPRKQMALVALAGPMSNFAMGLAWALLDMLTASPVIHAMALAGVSINAAMFVFNLLPIPPLDGGRILTAMLPPALARPFADIERYSLVLLIILVVVIQTHVFDDELRLAIGMVKTVFDKLLYPLQLLLN